MPAAEQEKEQEAATGIDVVFRALADPSRRLLLDSLNEQNGQNLQELCARLEMARQSVSKHLEILEGANLVTTVRRGREKFHYLNPVPIHEIANRWISRYEQPRVDALARLKTTLESETMGKPEFVYRTYVKTTPESMWKALTEPEFTEAYWGLRFETDWKPGSPLAWIEGGIKIEDPDQVVLEADPPRLLSYTWHSFKQEWADHWGFDVEFIDKIRSEPRSKVTFQIEPVGDVVKLTVVHDGFEEGSTVLSMITEGWPALLSSLKSLLETGEPLPKP
jgi:uncharacterized protein YndB with AHSA1/START domain